MVETDNRPIEGVVETISSSCWYVSTRVQGVSMDLLVDCGSTYTVLDLDTYEDIPVDIRPPLEPVNLILRNANGEILKVHGQTRIELQICDLTYSVLAKVVSLGIIVLFLG